MTSVSISKALEGDEIMKHFETFLLVQKVFYMNIQITFNNVHNRRVA